MRGDRGCRRHPAVARRNDIRSNSDRECPPGKGGPPSRGTGCTYEWQRLDIDAGQDLGDERQRLRTRSNRDEHLRTRSRCIPFDTGDRDGDAHPASATPQQGGHDRHRMHAFRGDRPSLRGQQSLSNPQTLTRAIDPEAVVGQELPDHGQDGQSAGDQDQDETRSPLGGG